MSDSPLELDLKFLPDWVKESPATNRYADYQGESADRPPRSRDDRGPRGPRPERRGPSGPRRDDDRRGPRGDRPGGDRGRGPRPGGGGDRPREGGRPSDKRFGGKHPGPRSEDRTPREPLRPAPAQLKIDFLPEPIAAAGIAKQIKASGRAYPVFGTSKLFLERPERHRVRVSSSDAAVPLYQVGDGPISFDRALVERNAFFNAKNEYYVEETVQGEPIKGNFTNVARVRGVGTLLGPTNYHGYQPALRKLYEERYSRRMPFQEFQQREIEIVSDEQTVAEWKEQARTTTSYTTTKEAEPVTFKTAFDAEQHFKKQYLPQIVKSGQTLECSGQASRSGADRFVAGAVRAAWEKESHFPQQIVNGLRPYFMEAGLHFFKHRKRVLYVSSTKPVRHPVGQVFSDGVSAILKAVEGTPRLKRPDLAAKLLGDQHDAPEAAARKEQLAADLHYLIHIGHVIEFSNGMLELPLAPQDKSATGAKPPQGGKVAPAASAAPAAEESAAEAIEEIEESHEELPPEQPSEPSLPAAQVSEDARLSPVEATPQTPADATASVIENLPQAVVEPVPETEQAPAEVLGVSASATEPVAPAPAE